MSALETFTELAIRSACAGRALPGNADQIGSGWRGAPLHCGTTMELVTPAVGPVAVGYSFEPADGGPVQLPPVWRCRCGFQLDAWIQSPYPFGGLTVDQGEAHTPARCA